jgi:hypothetical protein
MFKKWLVPALLFIFTGFPVSASMVSFLVVETGIENEIDAGEYSTLWEDGLMGAFFDAGHIVSNGAVIRLAKFPQKEFPDEIRSDYEEASAAGAESLVLVIVEYKVENKKVKPASVLVRIFSTSNQELRYQEKFPAGNGATLEEEYKSAKQVGKAVARHLKVR